MFKFDFDPNFIIMFCPQSVSMFQLRSLVDREKANYDDTMQKVVELLMQP